MKMAVEGIKKQGGDYNQKQLSMKFDKESITEEAVDETIVYGKNYKKWLVFAIDIAHADNICKKLIANGIDADVLHTKMDKNREEVIKSFKTGPLRALVSVGMVTTGFDAPNVDLLVLLRPTMSAVLHVQMVGRGLRVAPGKTHCLVLDFAGNTARLGPINDVIIPHKGRGNGSGDAPTKNCPNCPTICYAAARVCESCGHEFEFKVKLTKQASLDEIVRVEDKKHKEGMIKWLTVFSIQYSIHKKKGVPDSFLVCYHCGLTRIKEWVCLNHGKWSKRKADNWATFRGYIGSLDTHSVFNARHLLKKPKKIQVDFTDEFPTVINAEFEDV
jgi:DNA repair protein RadD